MRFVFLVCIFLGIVYANFDDEFKEQNNYVLREMSLDETFYENPSFIENFSVLEKYYKDKTHKESNHIFIPTINKVLVENGIPKTLLYLAIAESRLIPSAVSNKKAGGVWQFMPIAAKYHGLEMNKFVDERYDIEKSSQAASQYLSSLYAKFGKWYLAAAAYNGGSARVIEGVVRAKIDLYCQENECTKNKDVQLFKKTLSRYKTKKVGANELYKIADAMNVWNVDVNMHTMLSKDKKNNGKYLPNESIKFIETIVSLALIDNKYNHLRSKSAFANRSLVRLEVRGGNKISLKTIAKQTNLYYDDLKSLNRHIKGDLLKDKKRVYSVYIPASRVARYNKANNIQTDERLVIYTVQTNDTLHKISTLYGVEKERISSINYLDETVTPEQQLVIPIPFEADMRPSNRLAFMTKLWGEY